MSLSAWSRLAAIWTAVAERSGDTAVHIAVRLVAPQWDRIPNLR